MAVEGHVVSQRWEPGFISRIARCRKTSSRGCGRADTSGHFLPTIFARRDIHGPSSLIPLPQATTRYRYRAMGCNTIARWPVPHICRRQFPSEALSPQQYALALEQKQQATEGKVSGIGRERGLAGTAPGCGRFLGENNGRSQMAPVAAPVPPQAAGGHIV